MIHVAFVAPHFGVNTQRGLQCLADLTDVKLGVITQEPSARLPASLRKRLVAHCHVDDAADSRQIAAAARSLTSQWGRLDRLESYLELLQVPVAEARDALGLAGIGGEVARNFRDKNRMKEVLRAAGVPVARQALVRDAADARDFAKEVGFPIVLKPLAGQGAEHTHRVADDVALSSALDALLPSATSPVQAEEFIVGAEHTFETVTIAGRSHWSSSVQYLPSPLKVLENPWMQYCLLLPREMDLPHVRAFAATNEKALAALGLQDGFSHMEWFLRADGSPVVSEVGARPPGANIMQLLAAAHDADPLSALARLVAHREWEMPPRRFAAGCVFLRAMGDARVVRSVKGARAMRARLGTTFVDQKLPKPAQPRSSGYEGDGWVIVRHADTKGAIAAMRTVLEMIRVV
jgi:biotin carboxylase